jgi:Mce-associated membrane protein
MSDVLELVPDAEPDGSTVEPSRMDRLRATLGALRRLPVLFAALAVLVTAAGGFFLVRYEQLGAATDNVALLDTAGTANVSSQVSQALTAVLSYRYDDTASTERAAEQELTGAARRQYDQLFAQVRTQAPAQKLVLTTRVVSIGVTRLAGGTAQLLVFLDQSATRGDNHAASASAAQLSVTATEVDGRWLVSDLQPR